MSTFEINAGKLLNPHTHSAELQRIESELNRGAKARLLYPLGAASCFVAGALIAMSIDHFDVAEQEKAKLALEEILHKPNVDICITREAYHGPLQQFAVPRDLRRDGGTRHHRHSKRMARAGIAPLREPPVCPRGQAI